MKSEEELRQETQEVEDEFARLASRINREAKKSGRSGLGSQAHLEEVEQLVCTSEALRRQAYLLRERAKELNRNEMTR